MSDHAHKCISAWLGPSVWQYWLIYCSWPRECRRLCSRLTDCEWVWVTALWQSDESASVSYSLPGSTLSIGTLCRTRRLRDDDALLQFGNGGGTGQVHVSTHHVCAESLVTVS